MLRSPADRAAAAAAAIRALRQAGAGDDFVLYASERDTRIASGRELAVVVTPRTLRWQHGRTESVRPTRDPLADLARLMRRPAWRSRTLLGYLGFDLCRFHLPYRAAERAPLAQLMVPRVQLTLSDAGVRASGDAALAACARRAMAASRRRDEVTAPFALPRHNDGVDYRARVARVLRSVNDRLLDKAIVSRRVPLPGRLDVLGTWVQLVSQAPAARWYAFQLGDVAGVGASPELLLQADDRGWVSTNPLAGTRPRGAGPREDDRLLAELLANPKEVREHVMSVQLAASELRSVCVQGSVGVTELMEVRRYRRVQHLSSRIEGRLAPSATTWDALRAVFPGVTVSGIPKAKAVRLIQHLEAQPRGVYGGAVGWIDGAGRCDLALAIRSAFRIGDRSFVQVGAGILAGSRPAAEYAETRAKLRTILDGLRLLPE